uniref:Uncharacterized protein n=1 Tax=Hyaloperonospora arabidopsidis (strain Emoy2) TaxID=559515 RepID=M4B7C3_HYAAE
MAWSRCVTTVWLYLRLKRATSSSRAKAASYAVRRKIRSRRRALILQRTLRVQTMRMRPATSKLRTFETKVFD